MKFELDGISTAITRKVRESRRRKLCLSVLRVDRPIRVAEEVGAR
jgi:hypothetical protein